MPGFFFRITNARIPSIGMIIQTAQNSISTVEEESSLDSPSLVNSISVSELITSLTPEIEREIVPLPGLFAVTSNRIFCDSPACKFNDSLPFIETLQPLDGCALTAPETRAFPVFVIVISRVEVSPV